MDPTSVAVIDLLRELLAGRIALRDAAYQLHLLAPRGFGMHASALTPEELAELDALAPALQWEIAKSVSSALPDVPYGSPAYQRFMASAGQGGDT
jgi:hypothetical protein